MSGKSNKAALHWADMAIRVWTLPSIDLQDVQLRIKYTLGGQTTEATYDLTVQRPSDLRMVNGYPKTNRDWTVYAYNVMDQFGGYMLEKGMTVTEVWVPAAVCEVGSFQEPRHYTKTVRTTRSGRFEDELLGPSDGFVRLQQTITVEGWPVPQRCLTYYYGVEESLPGTCLTTCP